jgi:hypothetical protein
LKKKLAQKLANIEKANQDIQHMSADPRYYQKKKVVPIA